MTKFNRPTSVSRTMQAICAAIVALTDAFCDQHPNAGGHVRRGGGDSGWVCGGRRSGGPGW
ncbi:hypothetical protein U1T56_23865, partial [Geminicoccaceae bacterium SYSU G07066]